MTDYTMEINLNNTDEPDSDTVIKEARRTNPEFKKADDTYSRALRDLEILSQQDTPAAETLRHFLEAEADYEYHIEKVMYRAGYNAGKKQI